MSIDSELASKAIKEYEAMEKRKKLQQEVDFYSAMKGSLKFVSGYVKIIIVSIFIIILGGILIEILYRGGEIFSAVKIYIPLAIGSGLIFLFPVLLLSMAINIYLRKPINEMKIIKDDIMRLEIGIGLIPLVVEDLEDNLQKRISSIRNEIERETGICIPRLHIVDNPALKQFEYSFYICGKEMVKYEIENNKYLCIDPGNVKNKIDGKSTKDPTFGLPAILINKEQIGDTVDAGYIVADAQKIISTSLVHFIKINLFEIFSYNN